MPAIVEAASIVGDEHAPGSVPRGNQLFVETREVWSDEWAWEPELEPLRGQLVSGSVGHSELRLGRRYAPRYKDYYQGSYDSRAKFAKLTGCWVRVRGYIDGEPVTFFVGQIEAPVEQPSGDQQTDEEGEKQPAGRQEWLALGPKRVLERCTFARATWQDANGQPYELPWLPDFNIRHGDPGLKGNRSATTIFDETWPNPCPAISTFGGTDKWTAQDILYYALRVWVMSWTGNDPLWLTGDGTNYLAGFEPQISLGRLRNAARIVDALIDPGRGLDYTLSYFDDEENDQEGFLVDPFGLYHEQILFDVYANLANQTIVELEVGREQTHTIDIERGATQKFDKLRLVGDRVLTVFTIGNIENAAGVLWGGWTAAEEQAVRDGDTSSSDPTPADHDAYRADERFRRVFADFGVPLDQFNYGGGWANPVFQPDGSYVLDASEFQLFELGTLAQLPLEVGVDYTTDPPTGRNPPGVKTEYLPILGWVYDPRLARYVQLRNLQQVDENYPACRIQALEHDIGVLVMASPQYVFALGQWQGAPPGRIQPDEIGFGWGTIVATIALETDQRIMIEYELPAELQAGDGSVKEIVIPIAQFWWLTAYTVVGLDEDGTLLRSPGPGVELRNDINLLRAMMPGTISRLCYERTGATVRRQGFIEPWAELLGQMLALREGDDAQAEPIGYAPITGVYWDFERCETMVLAGQREH